MIDIHTHILPGLDDGAPDWDTALEMAQLALESGVTTLVATPHYAAFGPQSQCDRATVVAATEKFRQLLEKEGLPLQVLPGMEIFGTPDAVRQLREGRLMGLGDTRYPLIEFPFTDYAPQATDLLDALCQDGWRPVVAHPERYLYIQEAPELLNLWVQMGCLLQVNKGSLLGRFGRQEQALSHALVERGLAFVVASDAHSSSVRTTWMAQVQSLIFQEYAPAAAHMLLTANPRRLLSGKSIAPYEPDYF